jgi:uncharacterized membrane protein YraQ (UPF0718 family)
MVGDQLTEAAPTIGADRTNGARGVLTGVILVAAAAAVLLRDLWRPAVDGPAAQAWLTIFVSISIQAMPFLVLGVVFSGLIAAFIPAGTIARLLPKRPAAAVAVAGIAGVALPGCECGSVPIAGRLIASRVPTAAAVTFLLAAPAINPVVLVATAVAFPDRPELVVARFAASLGAAVVVGWVWARIGREVWVERARRLPAVQGSKWDAFTDVAAHDFLNAGAYLVIGALVAATLQVVVPRSVLDSLAGTGIIAVATMALLAVILSICSEADAFIAVGLTQFSLTSRLAFLVVGPMVDLKLIAMQTGVFGRSFAVRFAPLTFVVATTMAVATGSLLL